jgi:hypothetical protein
MRSLILFSALFLTTLTITAQVSDRINAEPEDLKKLGNRILVVELPEENPKVIEEFPKKKAAQKTEAYRASLASYREQIEPAVRAHWKFNEQIEFMTTSQIVGLFQKRSSEHVVLMKVLLMDGGGISAYSFGFGVPALMLTRTDGEKDKISKKGEVVIRVPDFQSYLVVSPDSSDREVYTPASMKATLILMQDYLKWNIKNEKSKPFMAYSKEMGKKNCGDLAKRTLMIPKNGLYKGCTPEEAHTSYAYNMILVDRSEMEETYLKGDASSAVLFSIPVGTIQGNLVMTYLAFSKLILDPVSGEIISSYNPGIGKSIAEGLMRADLKSLSKCDD